MEYSVVVYILLTVFVVLLSMMVKLQTREMRSSYGRMTRQQYLNNILVVAVFLLLFAVSACRIAVGNDYWVYRNEFLLIQQNRHTAFEPGFIWTVKALQAALNYDQYLPIFAFFSFFTVLYFVRGMKDQSEWFGYTVFLFMTSGYYFGSLNSVRYYLVLAVALYSIKYVIAGDWWRFVILILIAALFHKSVLVVIPFYWLASRKWKKWHIAIVAVFCASLVLLPGLYRKIIFTFYPFYEGSMFDNGETSVTNLVRCVAVFVLCLIYYKQAIKGNHANEFYFYCNLGALLLYTFASFIPEISRIGYYLNITNIFLIPAVIIKIPNKKQRLFWTICVMLAFFGYFALFLRSAYSTDIRLLPYRNWIFQ